ncbi:MFS transporter [Jatrophihabitans endophyticus]|uniref:MFS transporter n=1 Tax=Jatrophihabitans endophyticus TaxID=1206085 RepID=UPI0019E64B64|nr:MFS transporter [Jatrophihabitans endophyticus]MBE7187602.1 MFS transporter [Jatrophihabitans endophyticus]
MVTLPPAEPAPPADIAEVITARPATLKSLRLRGLFISLPLVSVGLSVFWAASSSIFLAVQIRAVDPTGYTGSLALVIGVSTVVSMIAAPLIGTFSDRTRTRIGARLPWMLAGAIATIAVSVGLAFANAIWMFLVLYCLVQVTTQSVSATLTPAIPERVPATRRGAFSAVFGLAGLVGSVVGLSIGAAFATTVLVGYLAAAVLLALLVLLFLAISGSREDNRGVPRAPYNWRAVVGTYWVNPVTHPDFAWAFGGRFLLFTGYFVASAYQLYILQDYIHLGAGAAAAVPVVGLGTLVGVLISSPVAGWLTDRIGRKKVLVAIASVLMAAGLIIPTFVPTLPGMFAYALIAGIGFGAYNAVDYVIVTQVLPNPDDVGKDLGIINITTSLPQTLAFAIASLIVGALGGYAGLFIVAAVLALVGALLLIPIKSVR